MRRVLVLGGTGWLGREIAARAVAAGAEAVCVARGRSGAVPAGARLVAADRTGPGAYDALEGEWDEVVELSYAPGLVGPALEALADRARHWTLVSTVSVYRRHDVPGADESADVVEPDGLADYGQAKVAAERATAAAVGDRLLVVRPGLIVGPGDLSDRFGYWPARLSRGGRVLAPVNAGGHVQAIDVGDLAGWVVEAGSRGLTGTVDAVGEAVPWDAFLAGVAAAVGFDGELVRADDDWLVAQDVGYWAGPRSLPLWLPASQVALAQRSGAAFRAAGGVARPLAETVVRTLDDERSRGVDRPRRAGLAADEEAGLLRSLGR
ncbi:NAD-dependent epimerase/dehydratase family protein [Luteimicrobium sp. DT211]|uniref:NAD-dependent epimerase/dehydratase family protein n=1 Tax=Luteimicrobium sp. DT211 TaxID=3393412 RepID=UPI003CF8E06A